MEEEFEIIEKVVKTKSINKNSCDGCCFAGGDSFGGSISPLDPCRMCGDQIFVKTVELKRINVMELE